MMKSLAVGAMLLHTMNAQGLAGINAPALPAAGAAVPVAALPVLPVQPAALNAVPAVRAPAPLLTPGINAPSEAELLGPLATIVPLPALGPSVTLPKGTADVVLDQSTSVLPFGAGSTPGTGISFGPAGWNVPKADVVPANIAIPSPVAALASAVAAQSAPAILAGVPARPSRLPTVAELSSVASAVSSILSPLLPSLPAAQAVSAPVVPNPQLAALPAAVKAIINNLQRPTSSAAPGGFGIFAVDDPVAADPVATDPTVADLVVPDPVVDPVVTDSVLVDPAVTDPVVIDPAVTEPVAVGPAATDSVIADPAVADPTSVPQVLPSAIAAPVDTDPLLDPLLGPIVDPSSIYDPTSPFYDPYAAPLSWQGEDNGLYEGEDDDSYTGGKRGSKAPSYSGPDDEEECPAWCLEDDSYPSYPTSTADYEYSPYKPSPTPNYPEYTPTPDPYAASDPYPDYEPTPDYSPYPKEYPTPTYEDEYPTPTPYVPEYEPADPSYTPQEPEYYPGPDSNYPQVKKVRAVRRQAYAFPQADDDDDDSGDYDGEDGSIPDWLYSLSGAPPKPTYAPKPRPTCPASCYKKQSLTDQGYKPARPTYIKTRRPTKGYPVTDDQPYYPTPTDAYDPYKTDAPYKPTGAPYQATDAPYPDYTSNAWYPQGNTTTPFWPTGPTDFPDEPTSVSDESTYAPEEPTYVPDEPTSVPDEPTMIPEEPTSVPTFEPTTLVTQYQSQPYPEATGGASSDPGSPAGDYTGDTLDSICPNVCNPFNPAENFCDITTGCATTGGSKYYCACRAGFRADNYNAKDFSKQFKVAGQPYVYLAVSTSCNTPCSDQTCSEVLERSQCK